MRTRAPSASKPRRFVAEDFCLIDDPPESEEALDELDAGDEVERPTSASTRPIRGPVGFRRRRT